MDADKSIVHFQDMLSNISKSMTYEQLLNLKYSLAGHMDQHLIAEIEEPSELIFYLLYNKLLGLQKTAFFRKLLGGVYNGGHLVLFIDEYKKTKTKYREKESELSNMIIKLEKFSHLREMLDMFKYW